eukprot:GHVT01045828.1.p1 GENE.GHVT01045828.1~~GHVT01045828.1.p1  ORF type:complete len:107 (+),score=0.59 GHVT01045828.1:194-514(+)
MPWLPRVLVVLIMVATANVRACQCISQRADVNVDNLFLRRFARNTWRTGNAFFWSLLSPSYDPPQLLKASKRGTNVPEWRRKRLARRNNSWPLEPEVLKGPGKDIL